MTSSVFQTVRSRSAFTPLVMAALALLALLQGYHLGVGDLATYLAFVWHKFDPNLLKNDLLIETLGDHPVYIWDAVALGLHVFDVQTIFLALFFLQIAGMLAGVWFFYRQFFGPDHGWVVLALTLVISSSGAAMGKYGLNPYGYFHPNVLAVGLLLLAFALLDRGKWAGGALLGGFIFLIHPFTALYAGLFLFFHLLLNFRQMPPRRFWGSLGLFALAAAPSWVPFFLKLFTTPATDFDQWLWLQLVAARLKFSYFISQWVPDRFVHLGLALAALLAFRRHPAFRRTLPIILGTLTALLIFAAADVFKIKFLLQLQFARCSYFLFILLAAYLSHAIFTRNKLTLALLGWMLLGYVLMIEDVVDDSGFPLRGAVIALPLLALAFIYWKKPPRWRRLYLITGFAMILLATGVRVSQRYADTGRIFDTTLTTPWEALQVWCARHVPADAVVMTPLYLEGFRSFSQRAIYGSFKDGAPHNYSRKTIFQWWERMQRLGLTLPWDRGEFPRLYHQNCLTAARAAAIRYLVIDLRHVRLLAKPRFQNEQFAVIDLHQSLPPLFEMK